MAACVARARVCHHPPGSQEDYVQSLVEALQAAEPEPIRTVVMTARGCSESELRTPQLYSAGYTEDIRRVVKTIAARYPKAPLMAVGYSLGANILVKYLAEEGARTPLLAAASIGNPWDLMHNMRRLHGSWFFRNVYASRLGNNLKRVWARCARRPRRGTRWARRQKRSHAVALAVGVERRRPPPPPTTSHRHLFDGKQADLNIIVDQVLRVRPPPRFRPAPTHAHESDRPPTAHSARRGLRCTRVVLSCGLSPRPCVTLMKTSRGASLATAPSTTYEPHHAKVAPALAWRRGDGRAPALTPLPPRSPPRRNVCGGALQYYRDASSARLVAHVQVPLLAMNADDDPVCGGDSVPIDECMCVAGTGDTAAFANGKADQTLTRRARACTRNAAVAPRAPGSTGW